MNRNIALVFITNLILNPFLVYMGSDFVIRKKTAFIIIGVYYLVYGLMYFLSPNQIFDIYNKIIAWVFLIVSAAFMLSFPMGFVFALTGGVKLAARVLLTVYLPVVLVGLANFLNTKK